ncbi:MAG: hypothetical protein ACE5GM_10865 [bacterium]
MYSTKLIILLLLLAFPVYSFASESGSRPDKKLNPLPLNLSQIKEDLTANDLKILKVEKLHDFLFRLTLKRGMRGFRAKWKIIGKSGSEKGSRAGNNAPRCETAAYWLNEAVWGGETTRELLVSPTVVRAFHIDTPKCGKACGKLPRFPDVNQSESFPGINDHLIIGALSYWIEGIIHLDNFTTGKKPYFFDRQRFKKSRTYRKSFSDLNLFIYLTQHGDANYSLNFPITEDYQRVFSVDNGHTFDGRKFQYKHEWYGFRHDHSDDLTAQTFSRKTAKRLKNLDLQKLKRRLRVSALLNLDTGESVLYPPDELTRKPLAENPDFKRSYKGVYTGYWKKHNWAAWGIEEAGIKKTYWKVKTISGLLGNKYSLFP